MMRDPKSLNLGPAHRCRGDVDGIATDISKERPLFDIIEARLTRRAALKGMAAFTAAGAFGAPLFGTTALAGPGGSSLTFKEVPHALTKDIQIAPGYSTQILMRWGDKVTKDAPEFDVNNQSASSQQKQYGHQNDFMAFMPLPQGSNSSRSGLLCINHENVKPKFMFKGLKSGKKITREQAEIEMAAIGHTILEVKKSGGKWGVVENSPFARRITAGTTPVRIAGPAAGHERMKTSADPTGARVTGTLANCAGGVTPWDTVLSGEENFQEFFMGNPKKKPEARNYKRYRVGKHKHPWGKYDARFNIDKEPNEPNRFGWVVEIDPYDPNSTPVKRTALGRFAHEGATTVVNPDGTVTVYSGDDSYFDYLYKFVTEGRYDPDNRTANFDLLDTGTLYVAKFSESGKMKWLPLVYGKGPLRAENGFASQADVLIETRRAADLLGATPMDRPEDVETNPVNGHTYVLCTKNQKRKAGKPRKGYGAKSNAPVNPANPKVYNAHGHIIELIPPMAKGKANHAATENRWEFFIIAGDPKNPKDGAKYHRSVTANGWLSTPDNCAFDSMGRIWICVDGQQHKTRGGFCDSVYAADTSGSGRRLTRNFMNVPRGGEPTGPAFTPDDRTFFVNVQGPGSDGKEGFKKPTTRWPDFKEGMPPRPSLIVVTKDGGGEIGS